LKYAEIREKRKLIKMVEFGVVYTHDKYNVCLVKPRDNLKWNFYTAEALVRRETKLIYA
jgi:hypothetical protein